MSDCCFRGKWKKEFKTQLYGCTYYNEPNSITFREVCPYKDVDVINTIVDLYDKAQFPNRVWVGLFLQDTPEEISRICSFFSNFIFKGNIKIKTIPSEEAKGCGWARNIILKDLYDNEDYFMCVDSHSRFLKKWDSVYIEAYKRAPANSVISAFPQSFDFHETYEHKYIHSKHWY